MPGADRAWVRTAASPALSGRKARDTGPELLLRCALWRLGLRYRIHLPLEKGLQPDIAFPRQRVAVFVDGCFWHGCGEHGMRDFRGPNAERWRQKIGRNQERDERALARCNQLGWRAVRFWECELGRDLASVTSEVASLVGWRKRAS